MLIYSFYLFLAKVVAEGVCAPAVRVRLYGNGDRFTLKGVAATVQKSRFAKHVAEGLKPESPSGVRPVTIDLTRCFRRPGLAITSAVETTLTANAAPAERLAWKTEVAAEDGAFTARTPFAYPALTLRPMEVRTFLARFR